MTKQLRHQWDFNYLTVSLSNLPDVEENNSKENTPKITCADIAFQTSYQYMSLETVHFS